MVSIEIDGFELRQVALKRSCGSIIIIYTVLTEIIINDRDQINTNRITKVCKRNNRHIAYNKRPSNSIQFFFRSAYNLHVYFVLMIADCIRQPQRYNGCAWIEGEIWSFGIRTLCIQQIYRTGTFRTFR